MGRLMGDLKRMIGGLAVLTWALLGCRGGEGIDGDMSGTYVNSAGGEYAVADDTLTVEQLSESRYAIHRRTGYNLRLAGGDGLGPRQYKREEWRAVLDRERGVLLEQRWGKELRLDRKCGCLEIGRRVYRKLDGDNGRINGK